MIARHSSRRMTYDSDAINALTGLLRMFSLCFQSECNHGLPTFLLDIALLWRSVEPLMKRSENFPTWSWSAWKGRVTYGNPVQIERDESGGKMETEGVRGLLRYF